MIVESPTGTESDFRVTVLTTRHRPDDDRIFFKEVVSLRKRYKDVTLVAPADKEDADFRGTGVRLVPLTAGVGVSGRVRLIVEAIKVVGCLRPDVCHFHDLDLVPAIPALCRRARRVVYDAHEVYPDAMLISPKVPRLLRPFAAKVVDVVEKRNARKCSMIVTADEPNSDSFRCAGVPVFTIFNYPCLELFKLNEDEVRRVREKWGPGPVLLYQGSMGQERGLFHMIRGLAEVARNRPDVRLALIGLHDRDLRRRAEDEARSLGIDSRLLIEGWVPHERIAAFMYAATIGLVPWLPVEKHKKNIPIKVFEYMACGLPILAANLPSIAPYISESGAGLLYDSTSDREFAEGVSQLLGCDETRGRMARAGFGAVSGRWNWVAMEERLLNAYQSILELE